jgi:hypothetical protein
MDAPLTEPPHMTLNSTVNPIARSQTGYAILFLGWCIVVNIKYTRVNVIIVSNINALLTLLSGGSVRLADISLANIEYTTAAPITAPNIWHAINIAAYIARIFPVTSNAIVTARLITAPERYAVAYVIAIITKAATKPKYMSRSMRCLLVLALLVLLENLR